MSSWSNQISRNVVPEHRISRNVVLEQQDRSKCRPSSRMPGRSRELPDASNGNLYINTYVWLGGQMVIHATKLPTQPLRTCGYNATHLQRVNCRERLGQAMFANEWLERYKTTTNS